MAFKIGINIPCQLVLLFLEAAVPFWVEGTKAGDIKYSKGKVTINVEGFYYIYSQMVYCGNKNIQVGHSMRINKKSVLKEAIKADKQGIHKVGGTFKLKKNDNITVSPLVTNLDYCFSPDEAYFGIFMVRK